ncbi:unnamed protein product [Euphydryas editha]|uniref:Protein kinase domain-containing protein n=1 Tax=Euphydryas editha TaxID=104508 RepID=A0AAU9V5F7_EUPED|nr:unnamed protein product [Euphydryas editha]
MRAAVCNWAESGWFPNLSRLLRVYVAMRLRHHMLLQCGTTLKLESLEDAVVLDDPEEDLLQDKRGCPAYVSPEILRAHRTYSGRAADMWSLGVILYTMLVGRYPFNDSEHASLFAKISRGYFVVPECLSSRGKCLIRSLLRREACERLSARDVLRHPWLARDPRNELPPRAAASHDRLVPDVIIDDV